MCTEGGACSVEIQFIAHKGWASRKKNEKVIVVIIFRRFLCADYGTVWPNKWNLFNSGIPT